MRQIKPGLFQARLWLPESAGGSINLGLYPSEGLAWAAVKFVSRSTPLTTTLDVWAAIKGGVAAGVIRPHILPKYVRRHRGKFVATVRLGQVTYLVGPVDSPELAHEMIMRRLRHGGYDPLPDVAWAPGYLAVPEGWGDRVGVTVARCRGVRIRPWWSRRGRAASTQQVMFGEGWQWEK
ncbi:hypothetical protein FRUB_10310 [Fimbriiglobus ruber]|uniref:Uncharacterized protein n=1 Tax=Fimbriiglobus ruber TaxID=1908690 RepID=A0A225DB26_9BACT|nr:hypothetical protein FRUB_10310 [Fimbriiglobus ruber]